MNAPAAAQPVAGHYELSHLRSLEAEAIHIIREVAAEFERPVLLFSGPIAEGVLWPGTGIKFAARRPGQAMLINPTVMSTEVIQTPHARPWEDGPIEG